jgi:TRAP-type C4-dicarboxylate transport system permease small subunit
MKKDNAVLKVIDIVVACAMLAIIVVVMLQVIGRTPLMKQAPHWTEEMSRMIFVCIVSVGAISATMRNEFVAVDLLTSRLNGKALLIYTTILDFLSSLFFLVLIPASMKFVHLGSKQFSPSLRINMKYLHGFILIAIVGMGMAQIYRGVVGIIAIKNDKEGEKNG